MDGAIGAVDVLARELTLFAAIGFFVGGIDDLLVDLVYLTRRCGRRIAGRGAPATVDALPRPAAPGRLAIFVAAWDESAVIGAMLTTALARLRHPDYRIYVGCYPNDRATIDAVVAVADGDPRVRLVIGLKPGPTTKADCLNVLWRALLRDDAREQRATAAVILHDAEDVVDPDELRVFDSLLQTHVAVQLPVLPLIARGSPFVSGHYLDEFSEAHAKQLVVREALGAGLPLAGVGCAIRVEALHVAAKARGGVPFDATSLTEDYELGLAIAATGGRTTLARIRRYPGGPLVATRAYFPATVRAAVTQKARWMTGIALAGWDRVGWGRALDLREHWMRMRDRRGPLSVLVMAIAYVSLVAWGLSLALHGWSGEPFPSYGRGVELLLFINALILCWRLAVRAVFTARDGGWRQGLLSLPRAAVANYIALLAARRAVFRYVTLLRGGPLHWDKTAHQFPQGLAQP